MRVLSLTLNTLWKVVSIVINYVERRVSVAIATQFLPRIAIMEFPLYESYNNVNRLAIALFRVNPIFLVIMEANDSIHTIVYCKSVL